MDFILADGAEGGSPIFLFVVLGLLIVFCIFSYITNSKKRTQYMEQVKEMQSKFTVGTKVKTYAGIYGEIVAIREALDGTKVVTIKSGDGENAMTFDVDIQYISSIDEKDNKEIYDEEYEELKKKMDEATQDLDASSLKVNEIEEENEKQESKEEYDLDEAVFADKKSKSKNKNKKD